MFQGCCYQSYNPEPFVHLLYSQLTSVKNNFNAVLLRVLNERLTTGLFRRSQWPRGLMHKSAEERLLGSWVRTPRGHGCSSLVSVVVLSGRGLCDGPIPRPEESYRLRYVSECGQVKNKNP
jgi:hypothetical protein